VTHTIYLHSRVLAAKGLPDPTGFDAPMREFGFQPFPFGMVKSWRYEDVDGSPLEGWGNPLIFPTMLRIETEMHWRVPINETATRVIILAFDPEGEGVHTNLLPSRYDEQGRYTMADFYSQDAMAWETQGPIARRPCEQLGASDVGISMFRTMLRKAIDDVSQGREPPGHSHSGIIDLRAWMNGYLPMTAPADPTPTERLTRSQIFDERHRSYEIPAAPGQHEHADAAHLAQTWP
jgi:5,5'-dehydrodivanillate O-demethylase